MKAALVHDKRLFDLMEEHGEQLIEQNFMNNEIGESEDVEDASM